jgi:hypothetical protein
MRSPRWVKVKNPDSPAMTRAKDKEWSSGTNWVLNLSGGAETMWKAFWKKWTIDKPAMLGDWLWDVFVVQLAAFLDRLTLRQVIAFTPVIILVVAYYHSIPIPPELMLVGDLLAYIYVFSVLFLLSILSHAATILFIIKQVTARVAQLATHLMTHARRLDLRHRRERGSRAGKRGANQGRKGDDEPFGITGVAWA